jgi:leukotriene-A4 hydrolase
MSKRPALVGPAVAACLLALSPVACGGLHAGMAAPPAPAAATATIHPPAPPPATADVDPHTFARPDEVAVSHLDLDLTVDFDRRTLTGTATLTLDRKRADATRVILDTRDLDVRGVTLVGGAADGAPAPFTLGDEVKYLGRSLTVQIRPDTQAVRVAYATSPGAAALQWLTPAQTAGGKHPFLFTQSQAILARTWVPCQDSPGIRMTYSARVRVPPGLLALMSATNPQTTRADGVYTFDMPQPIPSYLLALAVGDLAFHPFDARSGVYAERPVIDAAAWELADTPKMIAAAEALYGPYRWGRYDVLVLPPSFPFGGMENPRLTFATPTVLAGDRSLVALIAHELAHSWSGNLVTNATWNDFWLNEGVTTYAETRIMEQLYGRDYADMLAALGLQDLDDAVAELGADSPDTRLHLDLAGRDPDDGSTDIPYEKGRAFLRLLERSVGRQRWDAFLAGYIHTFAFQSITTARFLAYLEAELLTPEQVKDLLVDSWIYGVGVPPDVPSVHSVRFAKVDAQLRAWESGTPAAELETAGWSTHEWLRLIRNLPPALTAERMAGLDAAFGFTASGNAEIQAAWFERAVPAGYRPAYPALERFLLRVGRRKFLEPLYGALAKRPEDKAWARDVYRRARPGYHPLAQGSIDRILG